MKMGKIPSEWPMIQRDLASRVVIAPFAGIPRLIAGADLAFSADGAQAVAVAVVWDVQSRSLVEQASIIRPVRYPYVPGFLSFREGPLLEEVIAKLKQPWEVILFDGQGLCHPRRCGLATHMGVTLDRPAIGAAKSHLCGDYADPAHTAGSASPITLDGERVGLVLRTREGVKPMFISVGHRMDIDSARRIILTCCPRYRIPEPTRQADILSHLHRPA